jgi:hypothetical protein
MNATRLARKLRSPSRSNSGAIQEQIMGLFCANFHFRDVDEDALQTAIARRGLDGCRVLSAKAGWTSLYEEGASQQDEEWICELAGDLSRDLRAAAIAFMVHDSDIACYWLFDNGQQIDDYNSFPDYFDMDTTASEPSGPRGGRPELLLRYCRKGVKRDELATILREQTTFAESIIEQLAQALGIDPDRALGDYRHNDDDDDEGPGGLGGFGGFGDDGDGDDDDGDGDGSGLRRSSMLRGMAGQLTQMLGMNRGQTRADPQATALVQAAASDNIDEIARLLSSGVAVDAEAPAPLPSAQPLAGLGQIFPGGVPQFAMTPLLAAVSHKHARSAAALLDRGADPNRVHPMFGTPIHAAAGAGETKLVQLLIDCGADVNARNVHGQTPLQVLALSRGMLDRVAQARAMMKSLGHAMPGLLDQLSNIALPTEGWDGCEQLLKAHGAR